MPLSCRFLREAGNPLEYQLQEGVGFSLVLSITVNPVLRRVKGHSVSTQINICLMKAHRKISKQSASWTFR